MNDISSHPSAGDAITMRGVNLSLGRGAARVHILREIDLNIGRGEAVALLGPSGSGKSTLLMVMTGLERPDAGSVVVAGQDLRQLGEDDLARFRGRNVGIVFQAFHLIPTMTTLENVAVPLELAGERDALSRAQRELAAVGLAQRLDHYPAELSGGEQQRVALARALITGPKLLLADEPTGDLDVQTAESVFALIARLHREHQLTSLIATHNLSFARRCHRVLRLGRGSVEEIAPDSLPA
jgi:putative ABC transport system ATP-binding protein